jgi:O-acetyl-ADP-ribose deacetylase (regulator of RNase III)
MVPDLDTPFLIFAYMQVLNLVRGDITKSKVDAIVNAANSSLMGGGGVDGAIHRAGGPSILEECRKIIATKGPCDTGQAVITSGGSLPARFVIHTVGPIWNGGKNGEAGNLKDCYTNSLNLAVTKNIESIAFPNISTGIYGYPKQQAAEIAIGTISTWLQTESSIRRIDFVCFDEENYFIYKKLLNEKP